MGQSYALPEISEQKGRLIKRIAYTGELTRYKGEKGIPCELYQDKTVVEVFHINYERDIHRFLDYNEYDYTLAKSDGDDKGDGYDLSNECFLPHRFLKCGGNTVFHIKRTKKV